jgi:uncharacterized HAD superfamily protein
MKICALDLDGVLCEYPTEWVKFANSKIHVIGKEIPKYNLKELKDVLSFNQYKKIKFQYRTSGIKAHLPAVRNASRLTNELSALGYTVVILTARPIYEIKEVMRDTLFWLKNNKIKYDLLFCGKDKHVQILKYFPELDFMVEDNSEIANSVAKLGYKVFLMDNEYNRQPLVKGVIRIKYLREVHDGI